MEAAITTDLDGDRLDLSCRVDGQVMQSSNASDLIFKTGYLVSFISECLTLLPGTIIFTGTPEGIGYTRNPPFFLKAGQTVECEIEGIGTICNRVVNL